MAALIARFDRAPKPMYYRDDQLLEFWAAYLEETGAAPDQVDPDAFIRWGFARLIEGRRPRYQAIADRWGLTVEADEVAAIESEAGFAALIADALDRRAASTM